MTDPEEHKIPTEMQRRNRRFGIVLGCIVAGIFAFTFAIAFFVRYMDLHHHVIGGF